jgi:hypothetical protein
MNAPHRTLHRVRSTIVDVARLRPDLPACVRRESGVHIPDFPRRLQHALQHLLVPSELSFNEFLGFSGKGFLR